VTLPDGSATPAGSSRPRRRGRRACWVAASVVFAVTPWATLGFGTPVVFMAAAAVFRHLRRAHAGALWISAAVYTAALTAEIAVANSIAPSGVIIGICVIITFVGGGLQALFTLWAAATGEAGPVRLAIRRRRAVRARRRYRGRLGHPGRARAAVAILATASLTGGALYLTYAGNFAARHRTTTGTVTAVSEYQAYCGENCWSNEYSITVRYQPAGSRPVTFVSDGFDNPLAAGTHLPVCYLPAPHGYASLDTPSDKQDDGIFWIAVGLLIFIFLGFELITAPAAEADGGGSGASL